MSDPTNPDPTRLAGVNEAVAVARDLMDPLDENAGSDFARGAISLISTLWGIPELPTDERADEIEAAIESGGTVPEAPRSEHEVLRIVFTDEDIRSLAEGGEVDEATALLRARSWARHIGETATGLINDQFQSVVETDQP